MKFNGREIKTWKELVTLLIVLSPVILLLGPVTLVLHVAHSVLELWRVAEDFDIEGLFVTVYIAAVVGGVAAWWYALIRLYLIVEGGE
jgi:hypothetical protein